MNTQAVTRALLACAAVAFALAAQATPQDSGPAWVGEVRARALQAGSVDASVAVYDEARAEALDRFGAGAHAYICWYAASALRPAGKYAEALERCQLGLEPLPPDATMAPYLATLAADLELRLGRWADTHRRLDALADTFGPALSEDMQREVLGLRGAAFLAAGLPERAAPLFSQELALATAVLERDPARGAAVRDAVLHQVHLLLALNDHERVLEHVDRWLGLGLEQGQLYERLPAERAKLLYNRGLAEHQLELSDGNRERRSARTLTSVLSLSPSTPLRLDTLLALARVALDEARYDDATQRLSLARRLIPTGLAQRRLVTLAARLSRLRGELPVQLTQHARALRAELDALAAGWRAEAVVPGGRSPLQAMENRALLAESVRAELALDAEDGVPTALSRVLELQGATTLGRLLDAPDATLADARDALLPEGHGVLLWLPTVSVGSSLFAFDRHRLVHAEIAPYHEVEPLRARWVSRLSRPPDDPRAVEEERWLANELAALLLPDAVRDLLREWSAVTFVGADRVPLAWLPLDGERLGLSHALDRWPSVPVGVHAVRAARAATPKQQALRVIADAEPSRHVTDTWPDLDPLPPAGDLLEDLREASGIAPELLRAGPEDLGPALHGVDTVQFLAHAVADHRLAEPVALVLDGQRTDGLLWCEQVRDLQAPPTVLLVCCRSGVSPERRGDAGSADMAGAWLTAGAQVVLVSHDELTWSRAAELTREWHAAVADGASPAEALRATRRALASRLGDRAPFHDGLFEVLGAAQRASRRPARATNNKPPGGFPLPPGTWALAGAALIGLLWWIGRARR